MKNKNVNRYAKARLPNPRQLNFDQNSLNSKYNKVKVKIRKPVLIRNKEGYNQVFYPREGEYARLHSENPKQEAEYARLQSVIPNQTGVYAKLKNKSKKNKKPYNTLKRSTSKKKKILELLLKLEGYINHLIKI